MVCKQKVSDQLRAYIKFKRRTPAGDRGVTSTDLSNSQGTIEESKEKSKKEDGRSKKLSKRDERTILRQIRVLRRDDGNWTIKRLMENSNVTHVTQRTVTRLLHQNGYKYLQARKKGLVSEKDEMDHLKLAQRILKEYDEDIWKKDIAFYLDGVSFAYKRNPQDQAKAPKGRVWREESEDLSHGCTSKGTSVAQGQIQLSFWWQFPMGAG